MTPHALPFVHRRSSRILACAILVSLVVSMFPAPRIQASAVMQQPGMSAEPVVARPTPPPPAPAAPVPGLRVMMDFSKASVMVGAQLTARLTLINESSVVASHVQVVVRIPVGSRVVSTTGGTLADAGFVWSLGTVAPRTSQTATMLLEITDAPARGVLLLQAQVAADQLRAAQPFTAGVLVESAQAQRVSSTTIAPGAAGRTQSADGRVTLEVPAGATAQPLTLEYLPLAAQESTLQASGMPIPSSVAGFKHGLGVFSIQATSGKNPAVATFAKPARLTIAYTPEQLQARSISEQDLTIFQYNVARQQWSPLTTSRDGDTGTVSTLLTGGGTFQLSDGSSPSEAFLPSLQGWQVSLFTGAASFSYPIEVPAGPAGTKPQVSLSYSSAATDGKSGAKSKRQAGWAGRDWSHEQGQR